MVYLASARFLLEGKAMTVAFSSSESDVVNRNLSPNDLAITPVENSRLADVYELHRCCTWIKENDFKKVTLGKPFLDGDHRNLLIPVALQFPDSQLVDSANIALTLEEETGAQVFILGDVTYGSCCVDYISSKHAGADCLIHFGQSCLSPLPPGSIPVLFVFVYAELDCQHAVDLVQECERLLSSYCLLLLYEVPYALAASDLTERLKEFHANVVVSKLKVPGQELVSSSKPVVKCQRILSLPEKTSLSQCSILYLGHENMTQTNLFMNFNPCPFYTYNPSTKELLKDTAELNRTLKQRFYIIERIKDAQIIGILVGTLGVDKYLPVIDHLKKLIKHRKKRSYLLAVGKPNVPKLANFPEIQAFVLVSCGENSLLNSKEYLAPIATPFELELALNSSRSFNDGHYITDYSQLLPGGDQYIPLNTESQVDETDVSLITGNLRHMNIDTDSGLNFNGASSVTIRNQMALTTLHNGGGGEHLAQRSWQGLEQKLGMTPVTSAQEGQTGIASAYEGEG